jgi:hypothetical protein
MKPFGSLATRTRTTTHDDAGPEIPAPRRQFPQGQRRGQIKSIDRTRATQPEKLAGFKRAVACRDIPIKASQLTPASREETRGARLRTDMTFSRKDPHEVLVKQIQEALTALGWCVEPMGRAIQRHHAGEPAQLLVTRRATASLPLAAGFTRHAPTPHLFHRRQILRNKPATTPSNRTRSRRRSIGRLSGKWMSGISSRTGARRPGN